MKITRTITLLAATAGVFAAATFAAVAPAAATPTAPAEKAGQARIQGCHIRALSDGVRIRQAADPNGTVDGLLYRQQTLPSDCGGFRGAGHPGCVGGWSDQWIGVTFKGRRDYVSFTGDCVALHLS